MTVTKTPSVIFITHIYPEAQERYGKSYLLRTIVDPEMQISCTVLT